MSASANRDVVVVDIQRQLRFAFMQNADYFLIWTP